MAHLGKVVLLDEPSEVSDPGLNFARVAELLTVLRQRTPSEITIAVMALGGCFTPEMWHALKLLTKERSLSDGRKAS